MATMLSDTPRGARVTRGRWAAVLAAAVLAAIGTGIAPARAAATPVAGGTYTLTDTASTMCVDVPAASTKSGTLLQQWGCTANSAWQQFRLVAAGSGYNLVNVNSGLCIDVPGAGNASGTQVQQWGCGTAQHNQIWTLTAGNGGTYRIVNAASELCLGDNGSRASGAPVVQETCSTSTDQQWAFTAIPATTTLTVAADGTGQYPTVQAAIDAVPANNTGRVVIAIKPGTYREIVTVPADKPYITLQGTGTAPGDVLIVDNHSAYEYGTGGSATMFVDGHDFLAANLTISNDLDPSTVPSGAQALALNLTADRAVFDNVRLLGNQDTFYLADSARTYLVNSYVEGTVDFIFGGGIAVFNGCSIYEKRGTGGPITAASTPATSTYGILFYRSAITGAGTNVTSLGRPWYPDAQVLYRESALSNTIATAQPWTDMSGNTWQNARFSEYDNTGAGATINGNRPQLTAAQAAGYTPQKYLAGADGWNPM